MALKDLEHVVWHRRGIDQATLGDREPLIEGLLAMSRGIRPGNGDAAVLLVFSGADVELASQMGARGKTVALGDIDLKLPADTTAIFAQITPEPGDELRRASAMLHNITRVQYLNYSDVLADDVISSLIQMAQSRSARPVATEPVDAVVKAAHSNQMMLFLPRALTLTASLPSRPQYRGQADWQAVRLWLAVDELLWTETSQ
jgi:hypothetical protein